MPHPSNKPQMAAYCSEADVIYYGGQAGGGKALGADEPVLTPWGPKRIGDLKAGDIICNPDGSHQKVLYVDYQGVQDLYEVNFRDGVSVLATADHLWKCYSGRWYYQRELEGIKSTRDLELGFRGGSKYKAYVPVVSPVNYSIGTLEVEIASGRMVDPYVLGIFLGDGCLSYKNQVLFDTSDEFIANELISRTSSSWGHTEGYTRYAAKGELRRRLLAIFSELNLLGKYAEDKFIPTRYLLASVEVRVELLQGLLDSDGTAGKGGDVYYYSSSEDLARGVATLVRSLGGLAKIYFDGYYKVSISIENKKLLFKLPRKIKRVSSNYRNGALFKRRIISVEPAGRGEAVCIKVDHPNGLFITKGFVVTHNSDLLLGLAVTDHKKSIIFRREYKQLRELIDRSVDILEGTSATYSQTLARWKNIPGRKILEFGAVQHETDKENYKGRPHDFLGLDEVPDFTESQFRYLMAWNRTTNSKQRCRVVCTGNPPSTPEGRWVIRYWAPWLRRDHSNPALPGELRWFAVLDGKDVEVEDGTSFVYEGDTIYPRSRTFIPASIRDNPYFDGTGYLSQLQGLPEPLRSQLLKGDFFIEEEPQILQVIPTDWIRKAQARWSEDDLRATSDLTAVGLDPSRGGADQTVLSPRTGTYFRNLITYEGRVVRDGPTCAALVTAELGEYFEGVLLIDVIGIGASVFDILATSSNYQVVPVNFAASSAAVDRSEQLNMRNVRAEAYWNLREALDPELGDNIALPPDEELVEDLSAPLWKRTTTGILIQDKETIRARLGRSPGKGDAVAISYLDSSPGVLFR